MAAFVLCAMATLTRGQRRKATSIAMCTVVLLFFFHKTAIVADHANTYAYEESVVLECIGVDVGSSPPYNFTWVAPPDSTSLSRGDLNLNSAGTLSTLTFTVFEEDSGQYSCQIDGYSGAPATTTLTVGK